MKNPFVEAAIMAATMMAAMRENALRQFHGKHFSEAMLAPKSGHSGSKRPAHIIKSENRRRNKRQRLARKAQRA